MKIYLAARYSRIDEMNGRAGELRAAGHEVTSRWLSGIHQLYGENLALTVEASTDSIIPEAMVFARDDMEDVVSADVVISFTEIPRSNHSRGGRHVEFGIALALSKRVMVVGPLENVFYTLPQVEHYLTWQDALEGLAHG